MSSDATTKPEAEEEEAKTARRRSLNPELAAMSKIEAVLEEFADAQAVSRVLTWVVTRFAPDAVTLRVVAAVPAPDLNDPRR